MLQDRKHMEEKPHGGKKMSVHIQKLNQQNLSVHAQKIFDFLFAKE